MNHTPHGAEKDGRTDRVLKPDVPNYLSLPPLDRRSFVQAIVSAMATGPSIPNGSVSRPLIPNAIEMVDTLNQLSHLNSSLQRGFQTVEGIRRGALGELFNRRKREILSEVFPIFMEALRQRRDLLLALHARGEEFSKLKKAITRDNPGEIDFFEKLSEVLSDENASLSQAEVKSLAEMESVQLRMAFVDLFGCGKSALRGLHRYDRDPSAEQNERETEAAYTRSNSSGLMSEAMLELVSTNFSPEMYLHSSMPPSRFSLTVEEPGMTRCLHGHFAERVHREIGQEILQSELHTALAAARVEHLRSSLCDRAYRYLEIIERHWDKLPDRAGGERDALELYRDPRAEMGLMITASRLQLLDFEALRNQGNKSVRLPGTVEEKKARVGPLAYLDKETFVHDLLAESVVELTKERKLFFLNYPVRDLAHFKAIAQGFRDSSQFAKTFLEIYARLIKKGLNLTDYFKWKGHLSVNSPLFMK